MMAVMCFGSASAVDFEREVRPILSEYCNTCHSTTKQKGDLDLERFTSMAEVKKHPRIWEGVLEQLASKEMPPTKEPQPSGEQNATLTAWVQATLDEIALANAGDPGPVVLRRLSNAEFTYTIRDLTGVPALDPAREFPADGAAGEGFTNAGAALVMSPGLLAKYLDAAKEVANHAVLQPDGIRFSPHTTPRDWTDETLGKIREFYGRFSETGGATPVNLQGIKFDTNAGGRLPLQKYLAATLEERDALSTGAKKISAVATERGLNAKYLGLLWGMFQDTKPSLVLDSLRAKWRDGKLTAADIEAWQQSLWRFASVGHIGKKDGPKGWQEPVTPLAAQHEMRVKLTAPTDGRDVTVYLSASDAGDGSAHDFALWENARLAAKGRPDVSLRDVPGMDRALFGRHPDGSEVAATSISVQAPSVLEVRVPASFAKDAELVVTGRLHPSGGPEGSVQMQVLTSKPDSLSSIAASKAESATAKGQWSDNNLRTSFSAPVLVNDGSAARQRFETAFDDFRGLFPGRALLHEDRAGG